MPALTPADTYAVLVGIERYQAGWTLDAPANDVARFARWLCDRGVPPHHIHALVSLCRSATEYDFPRGCTILDATLGNVSHVIKHVIPSLAGKALFFAWGGHGIVDDDRERQLFLSDATDTIIEAVAVPALLRFLRSTCISRLEQQWFIIDTCANRFRTDRMHMGLARLGLPDLVDARRHSQQVMFAASVGERAANLTAQREGMFSGAVLRALAARPRDEWPPNLSDVVRAVDLEFAGARARQAPEYRWYRMGDREPVLFGSVHPVGKGSSAAAGDTRDAPSADSGTAPPSAPASPRATNGGELDLLFQLAILPDGLDPADLARLVRQPDVLATLTDRVVRTIVDEVISGSLDSLDRHCLSPADAFDCARRDQRKRVAVPVARLLCDRLGSDTARRLDAMLSTAARSSAPRYGAANVLGIRRSVGKRLEGIDLSGGSLRGADFRNVIARGVDLRGCDLEGAMFRDAFDAMLCVAFSADGQLVAAANADGGIRVWRVDTGQQVHALAGHTDWAWAVAFNPAGTLLASGADDATVRLWDVASGAPRAVLKAHTDWVRAVAFSADGRLLASGSQDATVRLWDAATGSLVQTLTGHQDQVWSVAFDPRTGLVASASGDGTVALWGESSNAPVRRWEAEGGRVFSVAFSHDGEWLATAGDTREVRIWHTQTGALIARLAGHTRRVWSAVFSDTGDEVVSSGEDNTVRRWRWRTGASQTIARHRNWVRSVAHHPSRPWAATASDDRSVRVLQTSDGAALRVWRGWSDPVWDVSFGRDARVLYAATGHRSVVRWDTDTRTASTVPLGHSNRVWALATNVTAMLAASAGDDETVRVWDLATDTLRTVIDKHEKPIWCVAFSPAGDLIVSGSEDRTARVCNPLTGEELARCIGHTSWVRTATFAADGQTIATGGDDRTVRLWDSSGSSKGALLTGHTGRIWTVAFDPSARLLASGGDDGVVRLWDVETSQQIELAGHGGRIWRAAFSPDGSRLATSSSDRTVRIWDVASRRELHVLDSHSRWVRGIAFAPDGSRIATGSEDGTVRLWDPTSFALLDTLARARPYERMKIAGVTGLSDAQRAALTQLGAVDE